jgi:hypothetical protein
VQTHCHQQNKKWNRREQLVEVLILKSPMIDAEEEELEKGVARSPRTRRRRISRMFSKDM